MTDATTTTGFIPVDGGQIFYEEIGQGNTTILWVHVGGRKRPLW